MSKNPMTIKVSTNFVYGKNVYAPQCDMSRGLAEFSGQKNLTIKQLEILKRLGFKIESVSQPTGLEGLTE